MMNYKERQRGLVTLDDGGVLGNDAQDVAALHINARDGGDAAVALGRLDRGVAGGDKAKVRGGRGLAGARPLGGGGGDRIRNIGVDNAGGAREDAAKAALQKQGHGGDGNQGDCGLHGCAVFGCCSFVGPGTTAARMG